MVGRLAQVKAGEEGQILCNQPSSYCTLAVGREMLFLCLHCIPVTYWTSECKNGKKWMASIRTWASYYCFSLWFLIVWWHCLWLKFVPEGHKSFLQLIISFPIASWPFYDCPSPLDWLYSVANCCYKTVLHCWIIWLSKILPYFQLKEKFHQNKKHKAKARRVHLQKQPQSH